jgi:uncharacterized protein (TIGR02271 family)
MAHVIVGIFDGLIEANNAVDRLVQKGISRTDVQVHERDAAGGVPDAAPDAPLAGASGPNGASTVDAPHEREGAVARIEHFFSNLFGSDEQRPEEIGHYHEAVRRGSVLLTVEVADAAQADAVRAALNEAGAVDIDERVAQWRSSGYRGYDPSAREYTAEEVAAERKAFPVVREDLAVGKREVQTGGVRVYSRVTATPVSETVILREERASVERRPVDRPATPADLKEDCVEVRETTEQPVVSKTAQVVEEVVVGKEATEHTETINDTVRGTQVEVERVEGKKGKSRESTTPAKPV